MSKFIATKQNDEQVIMFDGTKVLTIHKYIKNDKVVADTIVKLLNNDKKIKLTPLI